MGKNPPTFKETPLGVENLLWKLSTPNSPSCEMKRFAFIEKGDGYFWSATCMSTLLQISLLQIAYGLEHAIYPSTLCKTDFIQQNTYRNTLKLLSYTHTQRYLTEINHVLGWENIRNGSMLFTGNSARSRRTSVSYCKSSKQKLCQWHFALIWKHFAELPWWEVIMCVH